MTVDDQRLGWPPTLRISSCMAPLADGYVSGLAEWMARELDWPVRFVTSSGWQAREQLFDEGGIDAIWICGLPYVRKADDSRHAVTLLAAPVMASASYRARPVYFSNVVVRRKSPHRSFTDLRGSSWCYNEPGSHSGYNLTRYELARRGEDWGYFGRVVEAGSHQASVRMILDGGVDAAAIDSTVLELMSRRDPGLTDRLRVVATFGPSPIPPWVVRSTLPLGFRRAARSALLRAHRSPSGRRVLALIGQREFVSIEDPDYDPIREMDRRAATVGAPDRMD
jgi:phosphonate transport system substrate-binding protein